MKHDLQNIISGKGKVKFGKSIQTATSFLKRSTRAGTLAENGKHIKNQEESARLMKTKR